MADLLVKSDLITYRRNTPPVPQLKGVETSFIFRHTFAATFDYDEVHKLVFGILPAFCVITDAVLMSVTATNVVDVGLIGTSAAGTGRALDDIVAADTVGDHLFDGVTMAVAGTRTVNWIDIMAMAPVAYDRGIGLIATAADIAAAAAVSLKISYKLGPHDA